jgi:hypothetical protein
MKGINEYLQDDWFLRAATSDDHPDFDVMHEGDDIVEYDDVVTTLHVIEHRATGKQYGVDVTRRGSYDYEWSYQFLGEYEQREVTTTEWLAKKA